MKTAISLPDDVFREAEEFARRLKKSRSRLYQDALVEYMARHAPDTITEAFDRLADELDTRPDPFVTAVARLALGHSEW